MFVVSFSDVIRGINLFVRIFKDRVGISVLYGREKRYGVGISGKCFFLFDK